MAKEVMMRWWLVISIGLLIGCASSKGYHIPKYALTDPVDGISVLHPVELEKAGIKEIITFQGILDPGLWVEVVNAGGVWPFLAKTPSNKILDGYVYLSNITYWGDWQLQFDFLGNYEEIKTAKILYFNKDAGFAYSPIGEQIEYDPKKFEEDKEYQDKLFQEHGKTLEELDMFWKDYLIQKELDPPSDFTSVMQIKIPSPEWKKYKGKLTALMQYNYKMGNGEIRCGYLPLESFRKTAIEIPGFNGVDRYLKQAKIPLIALPFSGIGFLASTGVTLASNAIVAGIDTDWTGAYARAKVLRYQMAPLFQQITLIYKELLKKRDIIIKDLKFKLIFQE